MECNQWCNEKKQQLNFSNKAMWYLYLSVHHSLHPELDASHGDSSHISGMAYWCQGRQYAPCSQKFVAENFALSSGSLRNLC